MKLKVVPFAIGGHNNHFSLETRALSSLFQLGRSFVNLLHGGINVEKLKCFHCVRHFRVSPPKDAYKKVCAAYGIV